MHLRSRRQGGHFKAVAGRPIDGQQCKWMKGIKDSPKSPHVLPMYKNNRHNQMISVTMPWLDGQGNQQPKRQKEGSFSGLVGGAQPGAWTRVITSKRRYGITLDWVTRTSNPSPSLGKSRGAPLCQCCCCFANFVSFSHVRVKLAKSAGYLAQILLIRI